jgi:hypothetical protein
MQLSELIAARVVDVDGRKVGTVGDVRLIQDGPYLEAFGAALRVEGIIAGRHGLATRLGYHRGDVTGPWLLRTLFRRIEARAHYIPWPHVQRIDQGVIHLNRPLHDLDPLPG